MVRLIQAKVAAMVACLAGLANAQAIHGRVLLPDSTPAVGSIVAATTGSVATRAIVSRTGAYRLALPRVGRYEIRALRIGFRPTVLPPIDVAVGEDRALDIVLRTSRFDSQR